MHMGINTSTVPTQCAAEQQFYTCAQTRVFNIFDGNLDAQTSTSSNLWEEKQEASRGDRLVPVPDAYAYRVYMGVRSKGHCVSSTGVLPATHCDR